MSSLLESVGGYSSTTLRHSDLPEKLRYWLIDNVEAYLIDDSTRIYATDVVRDVLMTQNAQVDSDVKLTTKYKKLLAELASEYNYIELDV